MTNSNALAVRATPSAVMLSDTQLNFISKTEFVPKAFRGNLPAIYACVATGRSLGLPDITALRSIHIIDGKATFSAELMVQLVRAHGHSISGDVSTTKAVVKGKRVDNGDEMTATFTWEDAERAGLTRKQVWQSYPDDMLWSRAVSRLCRRLFADCFAGATYTPEEGEYTADEVMDEYVEEEVSGPEPQATAGRPESAAVPPADLGAQNSAPSGPELASPAQKKKLDVLVGTLREQGHITTTQVYLAVGRDAYPWLAPGDEAHWSPLRERLTKDEASGLIDRLEKYATEIAAA